MPPESKIVLAVARGDWLECGRCRIKFAIGVGCAAGPDHLVKCHKCGTWVRIDTSA